MTIKPPSGALCPLAAVLLSVVCTTLGAQTNASAPEIYTCTDAHGRKITSDRRIPECNDREQKILNPSGTVKGSIGPSLTAKERNQLETQNKAIAQERTHQEEEKKRDRALLIRYPNAAVHEKERAEALSQVMLVKQTAINRVTELLAERGKLLDEMAFYTKDPTKAPLKLRQQIEAATQALAAQGRFLADKDNELARTNTRFNEELLRLQPLWGMNALPRTQ